MRFIFLALLSCAAHASEFDTYRATVIKGSFCTVIGGACAGDTDFDSGFFQNPASLAASGATFDFDFDFDLQSQPNPDLGGHANTSDLRSSFAALGAAGDNFGVAIAYTRQMRQANLNGVDHEFRQSELDLPFAYRLTHKWIAGAGVSAVNATDSSPQWDFQLRLGALYQSAKNLSFGSWVLLPSRFTIGSDSYHSPLQWQTGAEWNPEGTTVHYLAQVDVIGTSAGGEANSYAGQPGVNKGRQISLQPHLGLRTPFVRDSRWNIYAGTYYEVSRVENADGREHLTAGVSYKLPLPYKWWDVAEFMAGVDVAKDYDQLILTFR